MGALWTRFRGKQTTYEILEGIDKDINRLQKNRKDNQERLKRFVTRLIIYSVVLYVIAAVVFFFLYLPDTWQLRFLYSSPLLVFPFIIWGLKKLLHWYFVKRIAKNDVALRELREKKKQILEDVMETETYKKAKEILEKFDPARFKKMEVESSPSSPPGQGTPGTSIQQRTASRSAQQQPVIRTPAGAPPTPVHTPSQRMVRPPQPMSKQPLRQPTPTSTPLRPMGGYGATPGIRTPAPIGRGTPQQQQQHQRMPMSTPQGGGRGMVMPAGYVPPPGPPMPRTVLPRDRGTMDRLMDYLVGDGPENRYALVCQQCYSHNGMALKEEFEYLSFRCCYCFFLNPARKQRPFAPRMEFFNPLARGQGGQGPKQLPPNNDESDEEDTDDEDEENSEEEEEQKSAGPSSEKPSDRSKVGGQGAAGNGVPSSSVRRGPGPAATTSTDQRSQGTSSKPAAGSSGQSTLRSGIPKVAAAAATMSKGQGQTGEQLLPVGAVKTLRPAATSVVASKNAGAVVSSGAVKSPTSSESRFPQSQTAAQARNTFASPPVSASVDNKAASESASAGSVVSQTGLRSSSQPQKKGLGDSTSATATPVVSSASLRSQIPSLVGTKKPVESESTDNSTAVTAQEVLSAPAAPPVQRDADDIISNADANGAHTENGLNNSDPSVPLGETAPEEVSSSASLVTALEYDGGSGRDNIVDPPSGDAAEGDVHDGRNPPPNEASAEGTADGSSAAS
ncbi:endoplasmic reticulum junction formation protein lunapark [Aplysia californica]|uniref:Endoplasmic reticulum junction formation protein lunapark n=1 Tax=Aplysia californica TaxID=6500 RepID=A0ABM0JTZ1_APLCA|nr:endoplasmic reticulum junction formation protein lunapark [Aplysia californica]